MSTTDCLIYKGVVSKYLNAEIANAILHNDYYNLRNCLSRYFCFDCIEYYPICSRFRKIIQNEVSQKWFVSRLIRQPIYNFDFYLQYDCKSSEIMKESSVEEKYPWTSSEEIEKSHVEKEVMNVIEELRTDNQVIKSVNLHEFSKDSDIATTVINKENYRRTIQFSPNIDFKDLEKKTKEDILHTITEESLPELLNQQTTKVVMQCSAKFENLSEFGIENKDVENLSASEIQKLKSGLGRKFRVNTEAINITSIKSGTATINFSIDQQADPNRVKHGLRHSHNFMYAKLHEILTCESFELQDFDTRGDKEFTSAASFQIGPNGGKKTYFQPKGYHRYGLKVLGKYPNDRWLDPFLDDRNWYRAFHGTANAYKMGGDIGKKEEISRDAMSSINRDGFQMAKTHVYGEGVYSASSIQFLEKNKYIGKLDKFSFAVQVCVDPDNCKIVLVGNSWFWEGDTIYVANTPAAIRPYGIIIK